MRCKKKYHRRFFPYPHSCPEAFRTVVHVRKTKCFFSGSSRASYWGHLFFSCLRAWQKGRNEPQLQKLAAEAFPINLRLISRYRRWGTKALWEIIFLAPRAERSDFIALGLQIARCRGFKSRPTSRHTHFEISMRKLVPAYAADWNSTKRSWRWKNKTDGSEVIFWKYLLVRAQYYGITELGLWFDET